MRKTIDTILIKPLLFIAWIASCSAEKSNNGIRAVTLEHHLPLSVWTDKIPDQEMSYTVYYFEDMTMYKYNYLFDSVWNGKLMLEEKRHNYFIFQNDSAFGYFFDSLKGISAFERLEVDSVRKSNSLENLKLAGLANLEADSSYYNEQGDLIKMYHPVPESPTMMQTRIFLYYNKECEGIAETFSRKLDDLPGVKLYKIRMVIEDISNNDDPKRQISYTMRKASLDDYDKLLSFFIFYKAGKK
jgi:hypothetical protein